MRTQELRAPRSPWYSTERAIRKTDSPECQKYKHQTAEANCKNTMRCSRPVGIELLGWGQARQARKGGEGRLIES